MNNITKLNLKNNWLNHPNKIRKALIEQNGQNNENNYKKYWLKIHFENLFAENNAFPFCIKEVNDNEFEEILNKKNSKVNKIENLIDKFKIYSVSAYFLDFEEDKYNYYTVMEEGKKLTHVYTIRTLKKQI